MADFELDAAELLRRDRAFCGVALADLQGNVRDRAGQLDADTLCAVGVVAQAQLGQLGDVLGAGKLKRWYLVSDRQTLWVNPHEGGIVVAVGAETKNAEPSSKALSGR